MPKPSMTVVKLQEAEALWERQTEALQQEINELKAELQIAIATNRVTTAAITPAQERYDKAKAEFQAAEQALSDNTAARVHVENIHADIRRLENQLVRHLAPA